MRETIEESAAIIWGMARDLASPHVSGAPLNSERNIKYIVSLLDAYAAKHSETSLVAAEVMKNAAHVERAKHYSAEIRDLKSQLAAAKKPLAVVE